MHGKIVSINVGRPRLVTVNGQPHSTAIYKSPIEGPVMLRQKNIDGDRQANLKVHGGPNKAVYAYPYEHYPFWAEETGRGDLAPGQFGENLTTEGLLEDGVCIGDTFRLGDAVVQATQPRVPCRNLGIRMEDATFPKRFHKSLRSGFYFRVLEEGTIAAGDVVERIDADPAGLSVRRLYELTFFDRTDLDAVRQAREIEALADEWREYLDQILGAESTAG